MFCGAVTLDKNNSPPSPSLSSNRGFTLYSCCWCRNRNYFYVLPSQTLHDSMLPGWQCHIISGSICAFPKYHKRQLLPIVNVVVIGNPDRLHFKLTRLTVTGNIRILHHLQHRLYVKDSDRIWASCISRRAMVTMFDASASFKAVLFSCVDD